MITNEHIIAGLYDLMYLEYFGAIETREAKPNRMFDELQNFMTRFLRPGHEVVKWVCPVCGKKRSRQWQWTQLVPFRAADMSGMSFSLQFGELLPALTPVCGDHLLRTWPDGEDEDHG